MHCIPRMENSREKFECVVKGANPDRSGGLQVQNFLWGWDAEKIAWEYMGGGRTW